jgi:hypothetical protein
MTSEPTDPIAHSTAPDALPKAMRIVGLCVGYGGLIGALTYGVGLPFANFISIPLGIALAFVFGAIVGVACSPFVAVLLRTRDLTTTKPLVFWTTALVTGCLTAILPDRYPFNIPGQYLFHFMGVSACVLLFMALVARLKFPRIWEEPGLCRHCGYDIRASREFGRCPECGNRFDRQPWFARRWDLRSPRAVLLRIASLFVCFPSLPLIVIILGSLLPCACEGILNEVRCRNIVPALEHAATCRESFDLGRCTSFPWEKLFIFGPYTGRDTIERTLGFSWPMADRTRISMSESFSLLVFVHDDSVAAHVEIPRRWRFIVSPFDQPIAHADAVFQLQELSPGYYMLLSRAAQTTQP